MAFDLPTQTGYDPDHDLARGEVGKVGVSIANKGDMHALFDGIPLDEMNTSMTINATAAWLLGLYVTVAEENGVDRAKLKGTTQNDIIKEYLSRGTYAFPPGPSMRLIADTVAFAVNEIPSWNPTNVCSYHLQEAGATPVQEIAYALSTAIAVLDEVKARGQVAESDFPKVFGRISFFVNAGVRFIEEHAKLRAMSELWEELGRERYGVTDPKLLRMRYGVQVNSLGLTESQPENNVPRIVLEALAVTLGRNARARAIQLPAWNEALGLPRPWDQQWSLRIQQILAFETDLLEYPDVFEGSKVDGRPRRRAHRGRARGDGRGRRARRRGRGRAVHEGPARRLAPRADREDRGGRASRSSGRTASPRPRTRRFWPAPTAGSSPRTPRSSASASRRSSAGRRSATQAAVESGARGPRRGGGGRLGATSCRRRSPPPRPARPPASGPGVLRDAFGDYRAPTGRRRRRRRRPTRELVAGRARAGRGGVRARSATGSGSWSAKPGLDGHSNGAEQIAVRARDVGMEVVYQGIRLTPEQIAASADEEDVDVVGLSILSGSHRELVPETVRLLRDAGGRRPGDRRRHHPRGRRRRS